MAPLADLSAFGSKGKHAVISMASSHHCPLQTKGFSSVVEVAMNSFGQFTVLILKEREQIISKQIAEQIFPKRLPSIQRIQ